MITMHSILRDRYKCWALSLDCIGLLLSSTLIIFTFSEKSTLDAINITTLDNKLFFGSISILLFLLGILHLKIDLGGKAAAHGKSIDSWFILLKKSREICNLGSNIQENHIEELGELQGRANDFATPIPDKLFNKLKREHLLKVEISKQLSETPGSWIWLIKTKLIIRDIGKLF